MPDIDFAQLLGQVQWEVVAVAAACVIVLQLVGAILHPVIFNLVTLLSLGALVAVGVRDGTAFKDMSQFHGQLLEMVFIGLIVLFAFIVIRKLFMAMARASRVS